MKYGGYLNRRIYLHLVIHLVINLAINLAVNLVVKKHSIRLLTLLTVVRFLFFVL